MTTATVHRYVVVLKPALEEGETGFTVNVPSLPGCITEGDTVDEALANAREAIEAYLMSLHDRGLPIPPSDEVVTSLAVALPEAP
jgi:predicted RNase H-like HicB family nuclease